MFTLPNVIIFLLFMNKKFGGIKLAKDAKPDKYVYSGYGVGFNLRSEFFITLR